MAEHIGEALASASARLRAAGVDTPLLDAQLLLAHAVQCSRVHLIAHPDQPLTSSQAHAFHELTDRRAARCPLAYLLGTKGFYGLDIDVTSAVLVPRPETELLVEECIRRVGARPVTIADVGTGSGAIAVAIAAGLPEATVYATDISPAALEVARANVEKHSLAKRVMVLQGDLLEPLIIAGARADLVVSNPPYIPSGEIGGLQPEVARYEPVRALDGGVDGLDAYRRLFPEARGVLRAGGFLAVEIGAGQANAVNEIAAGAGYHGITVARDLAGIERVVVAYL